MHLYQFPSFHWPDKAMESFVAPVGVLIKRLSALPGSTVPDKGFERFEEPSGA